jgi:hypothetical protein
VWEGFEKTFMAARRVNVEKNIAACSIGERQHLLLFG